LGEERRKRGGSFAGTNALARETKNLLLGKRIERGPKKYCQKLSRMGYSSSRGVYPLLNAKRKTV